MKKCAVFMVSVFCVMSSFASNGIDDLMFDFKGEDGTNYVEASDKSLSADRHQLMNDFLSYFSNIYFNDGENNLENVIEMNSVKVLSLDNCSNEMRLAYMNRASRMDKGKYELICEVRENGNRVSIFGKSKKGVITELVMVSVGDRCSMATMNGNFNRNILEAAATRLSADSNNTAKL